MITQQTVFRIILPAQDIPEDSIVTKPSGQAEFILKKKIKVHVSDVPAKITKADIDVEGYFLFGGRGSINQIGPDTKLAWEVPFEELVELWEEIEYEEDSQ